MNRRRPLPLLSSILPDNFVIDTSAWLRIDGRADAEDVWAMIVHLIGQGRIVVCAQVFSELRESSIYLLRLKPHEKALRAGDRGTDDIPYLQLVGRITYEHPAMSKATGTKTPADPYIVALAEMDGYVVVTEESTHTRPNRKIPTVCKRRSIRCLSLNEFIASIKRKREVSLKSKTQQKALSLHPIPFDEAVADILKIKPMPKPPKKNAKAKKRL